MALKGAGDEKMDDHVEDARPEAETSSQPSEESLLSLVQPELVALSKSWLAALKDHALLSLPPGTLLCFISASRFGEISSLACCIT